MDHPWLKNLEGSHRDKKIHAEVMLNLHGCNYMSQLLFLCLGLFCQFLNDKEIKKIRETFQYMDDDDSGTVELSELQEAFKNS
jgi:hypothetical protein